MDDANYADLLPSLSPLEDPDAAMLDRKGTMDKLLGPVTPEPQSWLDRARAADSATPPPMAAAATPPSTPAVPAGVTPSGKTSGLADSNASTIGLMQSDYAKSSQDVQREADQPDLATTTAPIQAQRTKDAAPIPAYDAQTGKVLDKYKPSFGQRLMRGVEGFARGGVLGVVDPAVGGSTPYGAPSQQYGRDVQQQQGRVASDDQQLKNAADNWKATSERIKQVASDRRALATTGKDVTGASIAQQEIPIRQQQADAETQNAATKADKPDATPKTYEQAVIAANQETDPVKKAGLMAAADQIQKAEVRRFQASAPRGNAANAAPAAPGDGDKTGEDYLQSLDPKMRNAVKSTANGDIAIPPPGARSPEAQAIRQAVMNYDPSFKDSRYKSKQDFKTKGDANSIVQLATALEHAEKLAGNSEKLGFSPLLSHGLNPDSTRYNEDVGHFTDEAGKLIKGAALTQGEEIENKKGLLSTTHDNRTAAIDEKKQLLAGKVNALFAKYKTATGQDLPIKEFFDKATQDRLQRLGIVQGGDTDTPSKFDWNAHPEAK